MLDGGGDAVHLYVHVRPGEPSTSLIALVHEDALSVETSIRFTDRGSLSMTVIGTHGMLREAATALPDAVDLAVDEVGAPTPEDRTVLSALTDRQRDVFRTAVDLGYYEIPRRTSLAGIADRLGCSPSTVAEHLRKAKSRVLSSPV